MLSHYPQYVFRESLQPLPMVGGFSGACVWRINPEEVASVQDPEGRGRYRRAAPPLCLRAWPLEFTDVERLAWIHNSLHKLAATPLAFVPGPLNSSLGTTWVEWGKRFWELSPWLPGQADYARHPSRRRLTSALHALARFHVAAAACDPPGPRVGPSPSLAQRHDFMQRLADRQLADLERACRQHQFPDWDHAFRLILHYCHQRAPQVFASVRSVTSLAVPLQVCHGDLWHDHVLFRAEEVSGFVDFGNLKNDCVAVDVARLLGSLAGDDRALWQEGLQAYGDVRPLSSAERQLVAVFDQTAVLLSGINWMSWLLLEGRTFSTPHRVQQRLEHIVARLKCLVP